MIALTLQVFLKECCLSLANEFNWGKSCKVLDNQHLIPLNKTGNHSEPLSEKQRQSRGTNRATRVES